MASHCPAVLQVPCRHLHVLFSDKLCLKCPVLFHGKGSDASAASPRITGGASSQTLFSRLAFVLPTVRSQALMGKCFLYLGLEVSSCWCWCPELCPVAQLQFDISAREMASLGPAASWGSAVGDDPEGGSST